MKTPNSLEEQMRSWVPRQPSPALEQRLFPAKGREVRVEGKHTTHLPWWQTFGASAVACAVLIITFLNVTHVSVGGPAGGTNFSLSNRSVAVSLAMASAPINTWSAPILSWTNEGGLGSTHRSFDLPNTNRLLH